MGCWGQLRTATSHPAAAGLTRYRKRLIQPHGAEGQRIRKTLEDAGIKLDSVATDILGASGRAMLSALVAGERDPRSWRSWPRGGYGQTCPAAPGLRGRFGEHHAVLIRLALAHLEQLEASIAELDTHIDRVLTPFAPARD